MKITVDTNILISAAFWLGNPRRIIKRVEDGKLELVLSAEILEEFEEIMGQDKFQLKLENINATVSDVVSKLVEMSEVVGISSRVKAVKEDPDDDKVLECAVNGKADFIVSGDRHLLEMREYRGIRIVTAKEMLKIIGEL
ncbi:MAG: putative toxin-antitoxin system toxin component, PIN family [Candidatus Hydrothermarchaeota archaeon]|nr:putative toxin-antitoxin system toxin component, PIN family [Candidatus Hydrothermarchaeota archaeon]